MDNESQFSELNRIISHLLIRYTTTTDCGLMDGLMGGVLFFALYAKKIKIEAYNDYSYNLIEQVHGNLRNNMSINFRSGLCGIGWGVEYLIHNNLMGGNTDDLLEHIDKKVMEYDPARISNYSFEIGLGGILYYVVQRMRSQKRLDIDYQPFDNEYLSCLKNTLNKITFSDANCIPMQLVSEYMQILNNDINYYTKPTLPECFFRDLPEITPIARLNNFPIGIANGLTGLALKHIEL